MVVAMLSMVIMIVVVVDVSYRWINNGLMLAMTKQLIACVACTATVAQAKIGAGHDRTIGA